MSDTDYFYDLPQEEVLEETAPFIKRFFAFIIDLLVFNIIFYPVFMSSFQLTSNINSDLMTTDYLLSNPQIISVMLGVLIAGSIIFCFYMALSEYSFRMTIGKQLMGLWVSGETTIWGFVIRNLLKSTFIFLLPFDLLGLLTIKKRYIDRLLGVNVLYSKRIGLSEGFYEWSKSA